MMSVEMSDYPDRISISPVYRQERDDDFYLVDRKAFPGKGVEYVRADRIEELEARMARAVEAEMTLPEGRKPITGEELSRLVGRMQGMALVNERVRELEDKLEKAIAVLALIDSKICWEINPSNYGHDEVCNMNTDWCEIGNLAMAALAEIQS